MSLRKAVVGRQIEPIEIGQSPSLSRRYRTKGILHAATSGADLKIRRQRRNNQSCIPSCQYIELDSYLYWFRLNALVFSSGIAPFI